MADKLVVKDFGPIENAELDIKKVTVLIGPQGSGKSTLAKLVAINSDFITLTLLAISKKNLLFDFRIDSYCTNKSRINFEKKAYYYSEWKGRKAHAELLKNYEALLVNRLSKNPIFANFKINIENLVKHDSNLKDSQFQHDLNNLSPPSPSSDENITDYILRYISPEIANKPIYIPAERFLVSSVSESIFGLINNNVNLPKSITVFGDLFAKARNKVKKIDIDYLKVKYSYERNTDKILLENKKSIRLSESASGHQAIIPLKLVVENNYETKNGIPFIVEEPELNLFPITQRHLVQYLVEKCTYNKNELLITTHSPYVLSTLNLLVFAYKTAQKHPERESEIEAIVPKKFWINPDDFAAYYVADGTARSIINEKTGMISENELDGVSDLIGDDFDTLMEIYRTTQHEAVN